MKETYKIEKLEDMPRFVPIIYINDTHFKDNNPRMVGNDIHDELVIDTGRNYLYYYNLQCGESSQQCSDFRFVKREAVCYDDEFYSHFCQMVDLEKLVADYTKQVRKEVCEEIGKNVAVDMINFKVYVRYDDLAKILDQIQGETNGDR